MAEEETRDEEQSPIEWQVPEQLVRQATNPEPFGSFTPSQITLLGNRMPGWNFVQPLILTMTRDDDGQFIASDDVFYMYGLGDNPDDAVKDYLKVLSEYYQHLSADEDEPSVALFEYLQSYIRPG